jgi:hypothetical protein
LSEFPTGGRGIKKAPGLLKIISLTFDLKNASSAHDRGQCPRRALDAFFKSKVSEMLQMYKI